MWRSVVAISIGVALGALLAWVVGTKLNNFFPVISFDTLAANSVGGLVAGPTIFLFASFAAFTSQWRLSINRSEPT